LFQSAICSKQQQAHFHDWGVKQVKNASVRKSRWLYAEGIEVGCVNEHDSD